MTSRVCARVGTRPRLLGKALSPFIGSSSSRGMAGDNGERVSAAHSKCCLRGSTPCIPRQTGGPARTGGLESVKPALCIVACKA